LKLAEPVLNRAAGARGLRCRRQPCVKMQAMRDQLRLALVVVMIVAAMLCAGCGSSDNHAASVHAGAESTPTGVSTRAQFVAQAQAICQRLSASEKPLKARQETLKGLPTAAADRLFVSLVDQVVKLSRAADSKLEALARPTDDSQAISKLLAGLTEEINDAVSIANAARTEESNSGEASEEALKRSIAANSAAASAFGMHACFGSE
jgi:hypothetical protein